MLVKYLLLGFVLLCSRQLVRSQFGNVDEVCKELCQPWEGDRFGHNTVCHQRYKDCRQAFFEGYFDDKGRILYNGVKGAVDDRTAVPCVDMNTKKEMKATYCRQFCKPNEHQLEFPLEVCEARKYCCTASYPELDIKGTGNSEGDSESSESDSESSEWVDESPDNYPESSEEDTTERPGYFWDDSGILREIIATTTPKYYID